MTTLASRIGLAAFLCLAAYANDEMTFGVQLQTSKRYPAPRPADAPMMAIDCGVFNIHILPTTAMLHFYSIFFATLSMSESLIVNRQKLKVRMEEAEGRKGRDAYDLTGLRSGTGWPEYQDHFHVR